MGSLDVPFYTDMKQQPKKFGAKQVITIIISLSLAVPFIVALVQKVPGSWIYVKWTLICLPIITSVVLLGWYGYWFGQPK